MADPLVPKADGWAIALLVVAGATDWLDGYLALQMAPDNQGWTNSSTRSPTGCTSSRPSSGCCSGTSSPWSGWSLFWSAATWSWGVVLFILKRRGITGLPVHFIGKAATFNLLYAFPYCCWAMGSARSRPSAGCSVGHLPFGARPCIGGLERCTSNRRDACLR